MRGSLQDQLLKAGLVKKNKPAKKHKKSSAKPSNKPPAPKTQKKPATPQVRKPIADNELEKPIKLQIKQLLKEKRVNNKEAEIPYNYTIGAQIKRCYVTQEQLQLLGLGTLAIVNWNDRSYLIPSTLVENLQSLHPDLRVFINPPNKESKSVDDSYDDHPIPDDLTW